MTGTTTLTLGGLLTALIVLIANAHPWWTGNRQWTQISSFTKGFTAAACAAACPGGLLGWAHSRAGTVANGAGGRTATATTGTNATADLTSGQLAGLSAAGAVIVVAAFTLAVLSYKAAGKKDKRRLIGGAYVGSVLCLTAGVAGALSWLPDALNAAGAGVVNAVEGAGIL
ncbi:hypothetical protein [Streptomyces sp. 4F14]|uniref:hypothetical protein n=1 Tax=Streptomyces sp. 4F14 TaxID=3394380 RepID=UPI003A869689